MLSRRTKSLFFTLAGPLMVTNGWLYRWLRAPRSGFTRVHLGPGQTNYLHGWLNINANMFTGKCDIWADLRNPLPFHNNTVDAFYSHHVIEHLPDLDAHFKDVYRCLKPGGAYRVGAPNGDSAIQKFIENDRSWFSDFPVARKSIGGRLENFIFCKQEHLTFVTYSFIKEVMNTAGFVKISSCLPQRQTVFPNHFSDCLTMEDESDFNCPHTLIVEGQKSGLE